MRETHSYGGPKLGGDGMIIEADETYIGGKAHNRAYGPIPPKQAVASLVERGGKVRSFHVPNVTANNLYPIVARHTHVDSRFMTDEANVYAAIGRTFKGGYETVNHSAKEYVRPLCQTSCRLNGNRKPLGARKAESGSIRTSVQRSDSGETVAAGEFAGGACVA
jgi:hypothetical protein